MTGEPTLLALDQGTTSTRAMLFERSSSVRGLAQAELPQIFPREGWVEHDPERIWADALRLCRQVLAERGGCAVAAIGITNQRETTVVWDRASGRPIHNAIVWQDRRGAAACRALQEVGHEPLLRARTGLVANSYFSATRTTCLQPVPAATGSGRPNAINSLSRWYKKPVRPFAAERIIGAWMKFITPSGLTPSLTAGRRQRPMRPESLWRCGQG